MTTSASSSAQSAPGARQRLLAICERGLERCRNGQWEDGLIDLGWTAEQGSRADVPGLCFSYLGYGRARRSRGKIKEGIRLCKHAIKIEFYQPENYLNLARTALLSDRYRRQAADAVLDGLEIDPENPDLLELRQELGARRPPAIRFLSRRNVLNRILGWFRHQLRPRPPRDAGDGRP